MAESQFEGVFISPITPFTYEGALDEAALGEIIEFFIKQGVDGIFALATAGQAPVMNVKERKTAAEQIIGRTRGRVKLMIQTGAFTTRDTITLTKHACSIGADAIALLPPLYIHLDGAAIEQYYQLIAKSSSLPVYVYNNPWAQGTALTPELLLDLHKKGYIVGVADSSNDINYLYHLLECSDTFTVIIAGAALSLPGLILGCPAVVTAIGNVIPESYVAMYKAAKEKRFADAAQIQKDIFRISESLRRPPFSALYEGLSARGVNAGHIRSPLRLPNVGETRAIHEALKDYQPPK